jgi:hypothetical protein
MTALALASPFEGSAASSSVSTINVKELLHSYWNRCVASLRVPLSLAEAQEPPKTRPRIPKPIQGPPKEISPGFIIGSKRKLGEFGEFLFRNVYPKFVGGEKRWVFRLVAANAFTFILWQVRIIRHSKTVK